MTLSFRQLLTLAGNGFLEILREPVFLVLMLASTAVVGTLPGLALFAFGEEQKLVVDSALALTFVTGLVAAGYHASSTLAGEIRRGTALVVLAKPVGRLVFLVGKFLGLCVALLLLTAANAAAGLLSTRATLGMFQIEGAALAALYTALAGALILAGGSNFFFRRPFAADAAILAPIALAAALGVVLSAVPLPADGSGSIDPLLIRAYVLIFCGLVALAGVALALSTRLDVTPTLTITTVLFLVGLMADYWFGRVADRSWAAAIGYALVPNWQQFWAADALGEGGWLPWSYVAKAAGYAGCYAAAMIAAGAALFRSRELG